MRFFRYMMVSFAALASVACSGEKTAVFAPIENADSGDAVLDEFLDICSVAMESYAEGLGKARALGWEFNEDNTGGKNAALSRFQEDRSFEKRIDSTEWSLTVGSMYFPNKTNRFCFLFSSDDDIEINVKKLESNGRFIGDAITVGDHRGGFWSHNQAPRNVSIDLRSDENYTHISMVRELPADNMSRY